VNAAGAPILVVRDVVKAFGRRRALAGVSLEARSGEIYALLGPNGAGKTTLARMVCGLFPPDSGCVRVLGRDPYLDSGARAFLGLAPQSVALYPQLTAAENLQTFARLAGLKGSSVGEAVERSLAVLGAADRARTLVRQLSGGLQRRINFAAALVGSPSLLVLDEPTAGLDVAGREALAEAVRRERARGAAVLLVTHDLEEADGLADRVGFLREGEKALEGAPANALRAEFGDALVVEIEVRNGPAAERILAAAGLSQTSRPGTWRGLDPDGARLAADLAARLRAEGVEMIETRVRRPRLADLYPRITGQAVETAS
jgi:ABC-2 type transport system ATP-binding protein